MNVLLEITSGKGRTFASSCATTEVVYVSSNIYSTTICKDDFDTIQNDGRIQAIEEQQIVTTPGDEDIETEIPGDEEKFEEQEQCGRDTCCKACSTPDASTDADQLMNVLVTVSAFDAISLLDSCMIDLTGEIYVDESGNTVHPMTICKEDFDTLNNNDRIQSIEEEQIVTTPGDEDLSGPDNNSTALDYPEDMNSEDTEACVEGTCCKTCVISDATEEGQYPQTYPDQVMNVLLEITSGKGRT